MKRRRRIKKRKKNLKEDGKLKKKGTEPRLIVVDKNRNKIYEFVYKRIYWTAAFKFMVNLFCCYLCSFFFTSSF